MNPATRTIKLGVFEGPLDLLLHLIKRNEVQIADIPIATITDQYLALLEERPELNLDGAGEYLVMAATLTFIKSRMLLPEPDPAEDEPTEDPRADLVRQLLEYQRYREVAVALGERPVLTRDVFPSPGAPPEPPPPGEQLLLPVRDASVGDLMAALREVLERRRPPRTHEVSRPMRTVGECVQLILAHFALGASVEFAGLFDAAADRAEVIVTFLALLELIRVRVVRAVQSEQFGAIRIDLAVRDLEEATTRVRDVGAMATWRGGGHPHADGGDGSADSR
ncbi:MAG: segregation/condensation protein A [Candidatus Binatia bacterium]